mgnify:CR=1 FL=1
MSKTITFNELRKLKDSLPTGSMHRIADELNLSVETVRNFFGAEMFDGKLYMSCDEENDMKRIFTLDVETGKVEVCFARNIGKGFEAEGLTVYADENGEPVICVLDRGERRKSSNLTFYDLSV